MVSWQGKGLGRVFTAGMLKRCHGPSEAGLMAGQFAWRKHFQTLLADLSALNRRGIITVFFPSRPGVKKHRNVIITMSRSKGSLITHNSRTIIRLRTSFSRACPRTQTTGPEQSSALGGR